MNVYAEIFLRNPCRLRFGWCIILSVLGLAAGPRPGFAEGTTQVNIHEKVEISSSAIRLVDIAGITGDRLDLVEKLRQVIIAKAPPPGELRKIQTDSIKARLKQKGFDLSGVLVGGSKSIDIFRQYQEADVGQIEKAVRDFIQDGLLKGTDSAKIKEISVSKSAKLAKGRLTYKLNLQNNSRLKRKVSVNVNLYVDGKWAKKMIAVVELEIVKEVVVARRSLRKGRLVTEDDLFPKTMDVSDLSANVITDMANVLGKRTKKSIDALEVLRTDMVEYPQLVKRGDIVQVIVESNRLKVSTVGMIQGVGGRRGDRVKVVNIESNKGIYARVIDAKTVKIDYFK